MTLDELLAIPYAERGRTPAGADCVGFAMLYLRHVHGLEVTDPGTDTKARVALGQARADELVPAGWHRLDDPADAEPGDLLLLRRNGVVAHLAVVHDARTAIHSTPGAGPHLVPLRYVWALTASAWRVSA